MINKGKSIKEKEGDLDSIEEICISTWEALYRYIYFKVQNREEAEDITQEAYTKALSYTQRKGIRPDKYIAFLKTTALNIIRDRWRKNKRKGTSVDLESIDQTNSAVDDTTEVSTQRILIENALKKLTEEQRTVIELRIINGLSVAQTAARMNKKETAVRVLQYRALQKLEKILEKND